MVPSHRAGHHGMLTRSSSMGCAGYCSVTVAGHGPTVAVASQSMHGVGIEKWSGWSCGPAQLQNA